MIVDREPQSDTDRQTHWENIYSTKAETEVSWYQDAPQLSLRLIQEAAPGNTARVIDVGGGASTLVDCLLELGYPSPTVLDLSPAALDQAKARLGAKARKVHWRTADITAVKTLGQFDVWHDRAVFHFLLSERERNAYVSLAARSLATGKHLLLATFAPDGPEQCSGLPVCRYDAASLERVVQPYFRLVRTVQETHITPWGSSQSFLYGLFRRG